MVKVTETYFNEEELFIISNSLISAIANCEKALTLVNDNGSVRAIQGEMKSLSKLNERVCTLNRLLYGEELHEEV